MEDCVVLRERDAVLLGVVSDWGFVEELSWDIEQGTNSCILEEFGRVLGNILEESNQWQRKALRDCVIPQGGDFRGSTISEKLSGFFWVF